MVYYTKYNSPLGVLTIASDEENIVGLWIEGQKYFGASFLEKSIEKNDLHILNDAKKWLDRYFNGNKPKPQELPLKPIGTEFRVQVWKLLCNIPYGKLTTYGSLAKELAKIQDRRTMSSQAIRASSSGIIQYRLLFHAIG